jgi:hypothetical protein
MTRDNLLTAKQEGIPFEIRMADGRAYQVHDPEDIWIRKTVAVVFDDKDCLHILPLLTMTGITYLQKNGKTG